MATIPVKYTEEMIKSVIELKNEGLSWPEVANEFNAKYKLDLSSDAVRKCYSRYQNIFTLDDLPVKEAADLKSVRALHRTKKNNSFTAKENRLLLEEWDKRDDLLEAISDAIKKVSLHKYKIPAVKPKKGKLPMTMELMISDVHIGKLIKGDDVKTVDHEEIKKRIGIVARQTIKEIERNQQHWNVERLMLAFIGDMIESSHMHEIESLKSCEFGTSKQVYECIKICFEELIVPIAHTGIKVDVYAVTGNHDRLGVESTFIKPGEDNLTYIIYNTLELLSKNSGLNNMTFHITAKPFLMAEVYGCNILWEHGNLMKNLNRDTVYNFMGKRQAQLGQVIHFFRFGHFHEETMYGHGRAICNGCVGGTDEYAEAKGFISEPAQVLNYYIKTDKRDNCFFRSFSISLSEK